MKSLLEAQEKLFDEKFLYRFPDGFTWKTYPPINDIKQFLRQSNLAVIAEVVRKIEEKYGKKGTMNGSFGYQGIVMGITAFQTPEDKMRDEIIADLRATLLEEMK